tara:strand:+ start:1679 stop:2317 length:639 start_codon:yes stop_codon:yes gene_type:complete
MKKAIDYKFVEMFVPSYETSVFKWDLDTESDRTRSEEEVKANALNIAKMILKAEKSDSSSIEGSKDWKTLYTYSLHVEYNIDGVAWALEELREEEKVKEEEKKAKEEEAEKVKLQVKLSYEEKKNQGQLEGQLLVKEVIAYVQKNYETTGYNVGNEKKWAVVWFTKETDLEEVRRDLYKRFGYNSTEERNAKAYCNYRTCRRVNSIGIYSAM